MKGGKEDMFGYAGQILKIDLSTRNIVKEKFDPGIAKKFIGGIGMSAKSLYDAVKPDTDALSPGNVLIANSSPLSGTALIGANKTDWASKSPLTGLAQTATSGDFGANLKWAGYDSMVVTGKADKPVYITIFDDEVKINDAADLWGKDVHEAADELWDKYSDNCTIYGIGPAGEKLAKISMAYTNKLASAGRKGSGAVVGSKNIKAIVVRGTKGLRVAHTKELLAKADELYNRYLQDPLLKQWMDLGTTISVEQYGKEGKVLWKNWRESYPSDRQNSRFSVQQFMKVRDVSIPCTLCPLGCKVLYNLKEGEYAGLETLQACNMGAFLSYGAKFDLLNYNQIAKCHDTANRLGIDTVEVTCVLDFLMDLQEQGVIDEKVTDGMKLERNIDTILTWMHKIANREGFGNVIADGYPGVFEALGQEVAKYAVQRRGGSLDIDTRGIFGVEAFGIAVGVTGPHANFALGPTMIGGRDIAWLRRYCTRMGMSEEELGRVFSGPLGVNIARLTRYVERWNVLLDCMGICNRPPLARLYSLALITELYYLATGIDLKPAELLLASERCMALLKLFNIRQGATRKDDYLPERHFTEPLFILGEETWMRDYYNTKMLTKEDIEMFLDDYYEERGWDKNGIPTKRTLMELELTDYVKEVHST
jgi:aldehyde:ferredoxin oxidoreductase